MLRAVPTATRVDVPSASSPRVPWRWAWTLAVSSLACLAGCSGSAATTAHGTTASSPPVEPATAPTPVAVAPVVAAPVEPTPPPRPVGCWEREFGTPPAAGSERPSRSSAMPGCERCEQLRVGPKADGLHAEVLRRVRDVVESLPAPEVDEPVLWINSGKRDGDPDASMHNQALGIDAVICGLDTRATGQRLREAGFTCVIEYYDGAGNPCHFAHADLRGTRWAAGAYAKGGRKSRSCPKRAVSRSMNCDGNAKRDWTYSEG